MIILTEPSNTAEITVFTSLGVGISICITVIVIVTVLCVRYHRKRLYRSYN